MNCAGYPVESYGLYVLNELEEPEASGIRDHLAERCTTCQGEVRTSLELWYLTALAQTDGMRAEPSAALRRRVLETARETSDPRRNSDFYRKWFWIPSFAAAALLVVAVWTVSRTPAGPAQELALARQAVQQWQERAEQAERRLSAQGSTTTVPAPMTVPAVPVPARPPVAVAQPSAEVTQELARARAEAQTLADTLARERAQAATLTTELNNERALLASVQQQKDAAEKAALGAADERARRVELETRLAGLNSRVQQLTRENVSYRESVDALTRQVDRNARLVAFLGSESLKMVKLQSTEAGQEAGRKANGQAFIVDGQRVVFYASGLPQLAPGRSYQLWLLRGKSPAIVSGGVFRPTGGQRLSVEFSDPRMVGDIRGLAVTEEPEGGSAVPTGHKVLVGTARS